MAYISDEIKFDISEVFVNAVSPTVQSVLNADGTYTVTITAINGVSVLELGISSIVLNDDYTLTFTYSNGETYTTGSIRGAQGIQGETGNGVSTIELTSDYKLKITCTDGTVWTSPSSLRDEEGMRTSEAYAIGKRGGVDVESGDVAYHNNSKYYSTLAYNYKNDAEQSEALAAQYGLGASTSKNAAAASALVSEGYANGKQNGTDVSSGTYYQNNSKYYATQAAGSATSAQNVLDSIPADYTTLSNDVTTLKNDLEEISTHNIFGGGVTEGYAIGADGGFSAGTYAAYTDAIPVEVGKSYLIKFDSTTPPASYNYRVHGYNNSDQWVQQIFYQNIPTTTQTIEHTITVPETVSYIRLSFFYWNTVSNLIVLNGTTITAIDKMARDEIGSISEDVAEIVDTVVGDSSWTIGSYIDAAGNKQSNNDSCTSPWFVAADAYKYTGALSDANSGSKCYLYLCEYTGDRTFIKRTPIVSQNVEPFIHKVDDTCAFVIFSYSFYSVIMTSALLESCFRAVSYCNTYTTRLLAESNKRQLNAYEYCIGGKDVTSAIEWINGYSIAEDGTVVETDYMMYTKPIPVVDGTYRLVINASDVVTYNIRIHAYDSNGDWLKQICVVPSGYKSTVDIPVVCEGYAFIKISMYRYFSESMLIAPFVVSNSGDIPLGLHTSPKNGGVLNAIKKCRQLTDAKWTPGFKLDRSFMETADTYLTSHGTTYKGEFSKDVQYKGLPYSERNTSYRWLGIETPLTAFFSSVTKDNAVMALESNYSAYGASYYGCVCTSLTSYALGIPYTYSGGYPSVDGMTLIANVDSNLSLDLLELGDVLQISGHCALITDIYRDDYGRISYIEISEQTRQGNSNREDLDGQYGSVCRRVTMSPTEFKDWFYGFKVYRYDYINKSSYYSCPYVPMIDEGDRVCINDYPLMPYKGNKTTYPTDNAPTVKLMIYSSHYTTVVVYKNGTLFGKYDINGAEYVNVTCDTDEAKYTACLAVLDENEDISYSTQSVEWYCRPHSAPIYSVSNSEVTISVTNKGLFKPFCIIFDTTFVNGGYKMLFDGDYTESVNSGNHTFTFKLPFTYGEAKPCKLFLRSEEWGVLEYNFTVTP